MAGAAMIDQDITTSVDHRAYERTGGPRRSYTEQEKLVALSVYAETLSQTQASQATGIPKTTIHQWLQDEESDAYIDQLRTAIRTQTAHKFVQAAVLAVDGMIERLQNGDEHFDSKENCIVRVKVKAKDCAAIASIATDKHALLTGSKESKGASKVLEQIAGKLLEAMASPLPNKQATAPD